MFSNNLKNFPKKTIFPKNKPVLEESAKIKAKQKIYIFPKKKPIKKTKISEIQKTSEEKKIVTKVDELILIFPKKKPILYQKPTKKTVVKSKYFSKNDFKLAKKVFSEIDKKKWTNALNLSKKFQDRSIYKFVRYTSNKSICTKIIKTF